MTLLLLGGTRDARILADELIASGVKVIYSIKGLVRKPELQCDILVGGFSQFGGLTSFIRSRGISAILDATHPYASKMTIHALDASRACHIPCWVFHRKAWRAKEHDHWVTCIDWHQVRKQLSLAHRIFLSAGQLPGSFVQSMRDDFSDRFFLLRTAVKPDYILPNNVHWLKAIGPFDKDSETNILTTFSIDRIVSKNSGGSSTYAKIESARELDIPVLMLQRPEVPDHAMVFYSRAECFERCLTYFGATVQNANEISI